MAGYEIALSAGPYSSFGCDSDYFTSQAHLYNGNTPPTNSNSHNATALQVLRKSGNCTSHLLQQHPNIVTGSKRNISSVIANATDLLSASHSEDVIGTSSTSTLLTAWLTVMAVTSFLSLLASVMLAHLLGFHIYLSKWKVAKRIHVSVPFTCNVKSIQSNLGFISIFSLCMLNTEY